MRRSALLVIAGLQTAVTAAFAQPAGTSPPAEAAPEKPPVAMEAPLPGDHWTYEARDEILGAVTSTRETTVTEVTPKEIAVRVIFVGKPNTGSVVFDRSWNIIQRGDVRFTPHDGSGIQLPLAIGKTWNFKNNAVNTRTGESGTRSGTSKVAAQESVTTKAGTFDTFRIESSISVHNVANPSRVTKFTNVTWYAPAVGHWVKRTYVTRVDGHLMQSTADLLVSYGRKQADAPASGGSP